MPFYMSYPMQNLYLTEMEYEKDMERMKELYPKEVKTILSYVEDECDKMEYEGSLMFDEYPDRLMLEQVAERISRNVAGEEKNVEAEQYWGGMNQPPGPGMPPPPPPGPGMPPPPPAGGRDDMRSLIGVLLNNEMYSRRCRHRRCRRWWIIECYSNCAGTRCPILKFQKESVIGIADLKKNAYNISVAFFRVSEEITKMAVLTGKMIFHSHRVRRQYRAERCN